MSPAPLVDKAAEVKLGHGQRGYVRMACEIPNEIRDGLVEVAVREGRTLKAVYNEALERFLRERA